MVSAHVQHLCQVKETVSSALEKHPAESPGEIFRRLYGHHHADITHHHEHKHEQHHGPGQLSPLATKQALQCGQWGPTKPSSLFLHAFADALSCLDGDPTLGMVSPSLMGSHGKIPLTIVAPLLDLARHVSNMIVRAEREVFFVTSVWQPSQAQKLISNALLELSRRAGERNQRVKVRIMFDKASVSNVVDPHRIVKPSEWTAQATQLPAPKEVPNLDLDVLSFHKLPLGTLHMKYCVVDRMEAAIMSNNIEDNDNLEMLTHLEGPIVQGIYDTVLVSWGKSIGPLATTADGDVEKLKSDLSSGDVREIGTGAPVLVGDVAMLPEHTADDPHYDSNIAGEMARVQSCYSAKTNESPVQATARQLNATAKNPIPAAGPEINEGGEMVPYLNTDTAHPVPMALVSRPAYAPPDRSSLHVPQNEAWLSLIHNAQKDIFIQTPDLNAAPLLPALAAALRRGVEVTYYVCFGYNDAGEIIPGQGGSNEQAAQALIESLPATGPEIGRLHIYDYVANDQDHPIHQCFKSRSCHIKLLIADGCVGVQGSGNQDTQSWFHSQEINIMIDSAEICGRWREMIERNQNTKLFGRTAEDGIWRDAEGHPGPGYMGNPNPMEGLFWGVGGMFKKLRDAGGL